MANKQGTNQIVDSYIGDKLIEARYVGQTKYFDAYTEITGTLPLSFNARVAGALKNYRMYGTSAGSGTPTESGEPAGYKIPILNTSGVTENLWDLDSFWTNSQTDSRDFFNARLTCLNDSTVVADKYLQINANGQYSITITSADTNYNRILFKHSGSTKDLIIGGINGDFSSQDSYTISFSVLGYNPSIAGGIKVENIMLIKGSTTPDHYIPHRYESNYDLFVGDSKLYEDEYLDFVEQKVYKRTENLFDKNAKDTNNGYVRWHVIISTGAVTQDSSWDVTEYINVKPSTVYTASNCVGVTASICFYDTNKEYISGIPYSLPKPGGYGTLTFTTPNNCAYARTCVLTVNQSGAGYEFERNVDVFMITEGSTAPSSYIPYLQPTDPPVPLPAIQAYQGENTLSSTETVGEVSVKGRISAISP